MSTPDPRTEAAIKLLCEIHGWTEGDFAYFGDAPLHAKQVALITDALTTEAARIRPACHKGDEMGRKDVLLRACYDLLKKCDEGIYMKNSLEQTVFYDEADCDGLCLMEDIALELGIEQP